MTEVTFYEKPGCVGNARQKRLLVESGHRVTVRDLLAEPWSAERLRTFLGSRPVAEWINPMAPKVKAGEVRPEALSEAEALALMVAEPLLIRRPLLEADGERRQGFDPAEIDAWIGLAAAEGSEKVESCPKGADATACAPPA